MHENMCVDEILLLKSLKLNLKCFSKRRWFPTHLRMNWYGARCRFQFTEVFICSTSQTEMSFLPKSQETTSNLFFKKLAHTHIGEGVETWAGFAKCHTSAW